jgi:hypothetical protein
VHVTAHQVSLAHHTPFAQEFSGGNDPENRESLWPQYNNGSDVYRFIATAMTLRNSLGYSQLLQFVPVEIWSDDTFYAFAR